MGFDVVIRNGDVVDGTGLRAFRADVGIEGDRITKIGRIAERGAVEVDAEGLAVTPGFIDVHTHYDAQVFWDPYCTLSGWHGITSVVIGVAVTRGDFPSIDTPVLAFFDTTRVANLDARKRRMTVRHLLTMTGGIDWNENLPYIDPRNNAVVMEASRDWVGYTINLPMGREPGASFNYSSGETQLLAHVFRRATGRDIEEYAARTPSEPSYFMKPPSSLNRHGGTIPKPRGSRFLNYEGEVAAVIGRRMKGVPVDAALDYVAGFCCANDVGLHDFRHADRGSMLRVKGQDGFLPLGPELVAASDWSPSSYTLRTYLNGEVVQEAGADDLIWPVEYQLADLCRLITLEPGDVVLTGTPANSRPMEAGDVVEVEVTGLGRLTNTVVDWDVDLSGPGEQLQVSANTLHVALALPEDEAERLVAEGRTGR